MKVGVLGGGQLARMIALAGYPLGLEFSILEPNDAAGALGLGKHLHGDYDDKNLLTQLANDTDIVTYEFENVPADVANFLADRTSIYPGANALATAQDRLIEKNFFHEIKIPTAPFSKIDSLEDLQKAMPTIKYPAILKSRRMGYDGKGQFLIKTSEDLSNAWDSMNGAESIVEGFVKFKREISMIAARSVSGEMVFYPISQNEHSSGILHVSKSCPNDPIQAKAEDYTTRLLEALNYVGIIAVEYFDVDGELVANEFAPRVHNSGHWTIEGSQTSQFENHLRAILDLPLGSTEARGHSAMVNFIGGLPKTEQILEIPHCHLHLYDKAPRKGRKVAHATICTDDFESYSSSLTKLQNLAQTVNNAKLY